MQGIDDGMSGRLVLCRIDMVSSLLVGFCSMNGAFLILRNQSARRNINHLGLDAIYPRFLTASHLFASLYLYLLRPFR